MRTLRRPDRCDLSVVPSSEPEVLRPDSYDAGENAKHAAVFIRLEILRSIRPSHLAIADGERVAFEVVNPERRRFRFDVHVYLLWRFRRVEFELHLARRLVGEGFRP